MNMNEYQEKAHKTAIYPDLGSLVMSAIDRENPTAKRDSPLIYQALADALAAVDAKNPYYPALGLAGEVGEFCNKLKKVMRDKKGEVNEVFRDFAAGELGDILWYLSECASSLGLRLEDIAQQNVAKLASRQERGTLQGNGDVR